mmetsp:Transcript_12819/g.26178  ORF Transcript_12819/g.26178 Transcript_12819/m.26178 type:complete len:233 (-) Transcript_12819:131-829(-)
MSTNYKKWEKFAADLSDSEDESGPAPAPKVAPAAPQPDSEKKEKNEEIKLEESKENEAMIAAKLQGKKEKYERRKKVTYQGRTIYEWEQTLEEVDIFIRPPPGVSSKEIICDIQTNHVKVGIQGASQLYMDEKLGGPVVKGESYWMMEDGVLHINLQKAKCGEAWMGATQHRGQQLNQVEQMELKQNILLERFQREHPGFDFSQAKFNGMAPDARNFMGGINTSDLNRNVSF